LSDLSDFDFLPGEWDVHNRWLRERLAGSDEWEEFEATSTARKTLDGLGNEDLFRTDHAGGFVGMSFRQSFSDDGGETWETNWVMEFTPSGGDR
jgi:hypothetical protein